MATRTPLERTIPESAVFHVFIPAAGENPKGRKPKLLFEPDSVSFARTDAHLLIIGKHGDSITVRDFFRAQKPELLLRFIMPDGAIIGDRQEDGRRFHRLKQARAPVTAQLYERAASLQSLSSHA